MKKRGIDSAIVQTNFIIIMVIIAIIVAVPLIISIMLSLKTPYEYTQGFWTLPKNPMWSNYITGIEGVGLNMLNSIGSYALVTFGAVLISSWAAYVFNRYQFPGKEILFSLIIALMIIPGVLTLTPAYLTITNLGLRNTRWAVILPAIAGQQIGNIFLFRTFMGQQPKSLYESAVLDGASDFTLYFKICLPLSTAIIIIQLVGIFAAMYNDFMWPYLVIDNPEKQMLMPVLKQLAANTVERSGQPGASYAVYLVSGIPLIFTTLIGLKYFINGDFAAGLKL